VSIGEAGAEEAEVSLMIKGFGRGMRMSRGYVRKTLLLRLDKFSASLLPHGSCLYNHLRRCGAINDLGSVHLLSILFALATSLSPQMRPWGDVFQMIQRVLNKYSPTSALFDILRQLRLIPLQTIQ